MSQAPAQEKVYTEEDYYNLPEDARAELIDGRIYYQAAPNRKHQTVLSELHLTIGNYLKSKRGPCRVFPAPFAVKLFKDRKNIIEPDISVICDKDKMDDRGCNGAPDWVIEVTSPSDPQRDYGIKLFKYRTAGVREYWIVNPQKHTVTVHDLEKEERSNQYNFCDDVPVCIYEDLVINTDKLL